MRHRLVSCAILAGSLTLAACAVIPPAESGPAPLSLREVPGAVRWYRLSSGTVFADSLLSHGVSNGETTAYVLRRWLPDRAPTRVHPSFCTDLWLRAGNLQLLDRVGVASVDTQPHPSRIAHATGIVTYLGRRGARFYPDRAPRGLPADTGWAMTTAEGLYTYTFLTQEDVLVTTKAGQFRTVEVAFYIKPNTPGAGVVDGKLYFVRGFGTVKVRGNEVATPCDYELEAITHPSILTAGSPP